MVNKEPSLKVRFILYPVIAGLFLLGCYLLALIAMGYNIKISKGQLVKEKTGNIILATRPGDARVYLDGKIYGKSTPVFNFFSLNIERLNPGTHQVKVEKDGYETWEGSFNVKPGLVAWGNYILLLPKERKYSQYSLSNIKSVIKSDDDTRMAILTHDDISKVSSITEVNTQNKEKKKIFESIIIPGEEYSLHSYSKNKENVILAKKSSTTTYSVIETVLNGKKYELPAGVNIEKLMFSPTDSDLVYFISDKKLYSLDYRSPDAKPLLVADEVIGIHKTNDAAYLVKNTDDNWGLWRISQKLENVIRNLPSSEAYEIKYIKEEKSYAILIKKTQELFVYHLNSGKYTQTKIAESVDSFNVSSGGKYILFQSGNQLSSYNVKKEKYFTVFKDKKVTEFFWAEDEANIFYSDENGIGMVNYNGYYDKKIIKNDPLPFLISNNYNLFFFAQNESLKGSDLKVFSFTL